MSTRFINITFRIDGEHPNFLDIAILDHFGLSLYVDRRGSLMLVSKNTENDDEITKKLSRLKLYFLIFYPGISINDTKIQESDLKLTSFKLKKFSFELTETDLVQGLELIREPDTIFLGFGKLINWLDAVEGKGLSNFCRLRDVMYGHTFTDWAYEEVQKSWPNIQFGELDGQKKFLENSHNRNEILLLKPDLIKHIKEIFTQKRMSDI